MPSRFRVKTYAENAYYHVFNRGVAKLPIFLDQQDYNVFLHYTAESLSEPLDTKIVRHVQGRSFIVVERKPLNFKSSIDLISYCLMPNHFHLLLKQYNKNAMQSFMRSLITRYAQYFNKRYDRVGPVFQGRYKAVIVNEDRYLLHLSRYIHLNPSEHLNDLTNAYSSYSEYLGLRKTDWLKPRVVLDFFNRSKSSTFNKISSYKTFVENYDGKSSDKVLGQLTLE